MIASDIDIKGRESKVTNIQDSLNKISLIETLKAPVWIWIWGPSAIAIASIVALNVLTAANPPILTRLQAVVISVCVCIIEFSIAFIAAILTNVSQNFQKAVSFYSEFTSRIASFKEERDASIELVRDCDKIKESLGGLSTIVRNLNDTVDVLPDRLHLTSLLLAIKEIIGNQSSSLSALCNPGFVLSVARSKLDGIISDIREIADKRITFSSLEDFLKKVCYQFQIEQINASQILSYYILDWVPENGTFRSAGFYDDYCSNVVHKIASKRLLKQRLFVGKEHFQYEIISPLEAWFLEKERISCSLNEVSYLSPKHHRESVQFNACPNGNLILACGSEKNGSEFPLFVIYCNPNESSFHGGVSINEQDLKEANAIFSPNIPQRNFQMEKLLPEQLKKAAFSSPQGRVLKQLAENLSEANSQVIAVDLSGCVRGNGIGKWKQSVFYNEIDNVTSMKARELKEKSADKSTYFSRIYIVNRQAESTRKYIHSVLSNVIADGCIKIYVIDFEDVRKQTMLFPSDELTDFHIVDDRVVGLIDTGPHKSYEDSEIFNLPQENRNFIYNDKRALENYINKFIIYDHKKVVEYINCFQRLQQLRETRLISSSEDLSRFLENNDE